MNPQNMPRHPTVEISWVSAAGDGDTTDQRQGQPAFLPGSESAQEYTPMRGLEIGATVRSTFLRGKRVYRDGIVIGEPTGIYVSRG